MSISLFEHLTPIMPGRKGVKRSVRTANIDIEPEDLLHDDPIDIVKIPSQNIRFAERRNENSTPESSDLVALKDYFDKKLNALEAKITNDVQAISTDLDEKFNSHIETVAEDNELKKYKLEQTLASMIKEGYKILFTYTPQKTYFKITNQLSETATL